MDGLIPSPVLLALAKRWAGPRRRLNGELLRYYVNTGILPRPVQPGRPGVSALFAWGAVLTLRTVLDLRRRGLPLQRYRRGLARLRERFPELRDRAVLSFLTDGRELIMLDGADGDRRAWELINRAGRATGQGIAVPVRLDLDLDRMCRDADHELTRYDAKRREVAARARRRADDLADARRAYFDRRRGAAA